MREKNIIFAKMNEKLAGYLRIEYLWVIIPYIGLITIEKEYQRKGIGKKMQLFFKNYIGLPVYP